MKAIKTLLAASALATVAGAANATVWNVEMSGVNFFAGLSGDLHFEGFTGQWDDATNQGSWTGHTYAVGPVYMDLKYTQAFTMNEATGAGSLGAFSGCVDGPTFTQAGNGCNGFAPALQGNMGNNAQIGNQGNQNYKSKVAFAPADGLVMQWTFGVSKQITAPDGSTSLQYIPLPMNVTLSAVPVPAAAWLFGSGLLGLAGTARRRRSV